MYNLDDCFILFSFAMRFEKVDSMVLHIFVPRPVNQIPRWMDCFSWQPLSSQKGVFVLLDLAVAGGVFKKFSIGQKSRRIDDEKRVALLST